MDRSKLKPSEVKKTSNIFGPIQEDNESSGNGSEGDHQDIEVDEEDDEDDDEDDEAMKDDFDVAEASEDSDSQDEDNAPPTTKKRKKNDPADFSLAMQKILGSGLTLANRQNPILARSIESKKLDEAAAEEKLETKARRQMTLEKKLALDKNHNASVVGATDAEVARSIERERGMRKIAQRGVVTLFNAIRAAQTSAQDGELAAKRDDRTGLKVRQGAGVKKREVKAQEASKSTFLDMIKAGGAGARKVV